MEAAVGMAAGKIAPKLLDLLVSNHNLRADLEHDIQYIKKEFLMICAAIREDEARRERGGCGSNEVETAWIRMVRDLARAIEDCIDRFMHRVTLKTDASWIRKKLYRVRTVPARNKFAAAIHRLRKKSEEASELRKKYNREYGDGGCVGAGSSTMERKRSGPTIKYLAATPIEEAQTSDEETDTDICPAVGMEAPLDDLMDLIRETQGQTLNELKVISLVGFGGIGKTRLARHVYSSPIVVSKYQPRAWVRASGKDAADVLREILRQIGMRSTIGIAGRGGSTGRLRKIRTSLRECLGSKRFFIVIDDMRDEFWHQIKDAFPVVPGVSSRIMVTTALRSVAKACSSSRGHAYMMRTLAKEHSRQLFFREASLEDPPPPGDQTQLATSEALIKCDGLPLALLTTAMFFQSGGDPANWADLSENLGKYLETKKTLARMKRVLVYSYTSLGSQQVKTCLLYMGIYPSGRPISKGSLIRRWLAEGFIQGDIKQSAIKAATGTFDELVNRSIIQPNDGSSNMNSAEVKTCQTHGMMIEFILHKSTCENFVTLLYDEAPLHSNIRWLSLHHKSAKSARMNPKDLHLVRSLTVFGKAHNSMLDFSKYELLRVLDLEQCSNDLEKKHIKQICKLLLLRYLSLGASVKVKVLPKEIKKLQLLETLDIRRTIIEILPTQIMKLPCLIHMFGRFKLQHNIGGRRMRKLHAFMSKKSKLETVAGFVVDDKSQGSAQLVEHMKHLSKMKIWCKYTVDARSNLTHLSEAIKGFIARGTNSNSSLSLSLKFNDEWSHNMLMNLSLEKEKDSSCYLSSLKLQGGKICSLPPFVTMMGGITKLCLSSPYHQLNSDILVALSSVRHLEYLKLVASKLTKVVIGHVGFESLRHLCIMVEVMAELEIKEEALPFLESLRLLSNDQHGFRGTIIQSLLCLKEVALYDGVNDKTKQEWKEAAKKHPRCPRLLFVEMKQMESEPDLEIFTAGAATNTRTEEVYVENELEMKINSMASPTTVMLSVTRPPDAISTRESVQVDGNGQHDNDDDDDDDDGDDDDYNDGDDDDDNDDDNDDDDDEKEVMDETEIFAEKNGPISEVIYPMNKECSIESTKGEKCSWG